MSKIVMSDISGGYNLSAIGDNFDKIATELNTKVLYRDNPPGESNSLLTDIDANQKRIYNLPAPVASFEPVRLKELNDLLGGSLTPNWNDIVGKPSTFPPSSHTHPISDVVNLQTELNDKQDVLISGTTIKTINGTSVLGSGDIAITAGENNTASNVGASGVGVFKQKTGVNLEFKKLVQGTNVSFVDDGTTITISSTGGAGGGDVSGPASSVNNAVVLFDGTTGKLIKDSTKLLPSGDIVGLSDTQSLTNKTINFSNNTVSGTLSQFNTALSDADFATLAGSETLTNKTLNLSSNTLTGTVAQFNTALSDGDFTTISGTETLTNKTLTSPVLIGTPVEDTFTITDAAGFEINPANGSIQLITLGANRTPTAAAGWQAGQGVLLMVDDGTAYTLTWTTIGVTWLTSDGNAPTLRTTGYTAIALWKVGSTIYGK